MGVIKFERDFSTLFNWDNDESPTTEQEYQNAVKNWTETEMNIVDTLLWQPETDYVENNIVKTPSLPLHYVLVCTTGGTSGTEEPSYDNVQIGDSVTDGTVTWTVAKLTVSSDVPTVTDRAMVDASNVGVNAEEDNSEAWASAIGGGAVAEDDGKLVTGGTVHAVTSVLASDIADNTDDIATNTANISQNATDIDIADKRISNIEKLLQGNLYDYQTDSDSAYTKTVLAGAMPYASLNEVGGRTLVWNQLCQNEKPTSTTNDVTFTNNGDGSWTINGTATAGSNKPFSTFATVSGHKYYIKACPSGGSGTTYYANISGLGSADTGNGVITEINSSANLNLRLVFSAGVTFDNVKIYPQCVDLTLLYGAGNEPTTVAEFQQTFPAVWYAYNPGSLLSAGVTEVVSKGKNLVNQDDIFSVLSGATKVNDYWACTTNQLGIKYPYNNYNTNISPVFTQSSLTMSFDVKVDASASVNVTLYYGFFRESSAGGILSNILCTSEWKHVSVTVNNNVACKIAFSYSGGTKVNIRNFQIEASASATSYSPYHAPIQYPIPSAIQQLEGYGWSAGTAYNYVDYERKVFVKNVDRVDLGTLTWELRNDTALRQAFISALSNISNIKTVSSNNEKPNILTVKFITIVGQTSWQPYNITQYLEGSGNNLVACVNPSEYSSASAFKSAMSGVIMFYELQTPVETDISAYITDDNLISVASGGTLTFPNALGDDYRIDVPSAETYMVDLQSALGN